MCRALRAVTTVALVALASSASALTFTCEGIIRKGGMDPAGAVFGGKVGDQRRGGPAINGGGDVTFFATPHGGPRRLYLYPAVGAPSILAEQHAAAPGGGTFALFQRPSINDAGDVAFFGDLGSAKGVFIKPAAGALFQVARTGDPAPGGGTFAAFDGVSRINASGDVAFLARVTGGPRGVFRYDGAMMVLTSVARVGDVALDGREICEFVAPSVGLGATRSAFHVITSSSCLSPSARQVIGIYRETGLGIDRVALQGDATPTPGTTYGAFYGDPDLNALDQVLVRANADGPPLFTGLFLFDPVSAATTIVGTGNAAPGGGFLKTIAEPSLTDDGRAAFRGSISDDPARDGIFLFGGVAEAVVRRTDLVPTNIFAARSGYRKIFEEIGVDRSGTRVTFTANVHEPSGTRLGLFRCTGS